MCIAVNKTHDKTKEWPLLIQIITPHLFSDEGDDSSFGSDTQKVCVICLILTIFVHS